MPRGRTTRELLEKQLAAREWFDVRSFLGHASWANFFFFLGSRETGKTVSCQRYLLNSYFNRDAKLYWLRLKENSINKLLQNDGKKFIDGVLIDEFEEKGKHIELKRHGNELYMVNGEGKEKPFVTLYALSTAYAQKGLSEFDATDPRPIIIVCDECMLEQGEKRTFDVLYNLAVQLENLVRSRTKDVKVIFMANATQEASDLLASFGFIPEKLGVFKLRRKKCLIVNMKNSEAYEKRRKGTIGNILAGETANYTNMIEVDTSLITKQKLHKPTLIIKFTKSKKDWFTVWDGEVIAPYNGEKKNSISMARYLDSRFTPEERDTIFELYDQRAMKFKNLMTYKRFGYLLSLIKTK